ncbi:MAG: hypothetical protein ACYTBV_04615 [Planctomycetota bacterium]|jgi:hypothetical protein
MLKNIEYNTTAALVVLFAVAFGLGVACFLLTAYHAENAIGSPSSTSCLILIFIPGFAVAGAIGGCIFGLIFSLILRLFKISTISRSKFIPLGLILTAGLTLIAGLAGFMMVKNYVGFNEPRVIYSDGSLIKKAISAKSVVPDNVIIPFEWQNEGALVFWNDAKINLNFPSDEVRAIDTNNNIIIQTSLNKFDYIRELQAREVRLSLSERNYLAVLADLRATSHHTMLLIYLPSGSLIYQEMFDTRGQDLIMGIDKLDSGMDVLIVKSKDGTFSYSLK